MKDSKESKIKKEAKETKPQKDILIKSEELQNMDEIFQDDDKAKLALDKLFMKLLKPSKEVQNLFSQAKKDYIKGNLSQFDIKLVTTLFSRREEDINKEMENVQFDVDFGSYEFQKKFYAKYILMKCQDCSDEEEKSKYLEIKVSLQKTKEPYFITQLKLFESLTKFRLIYKSYCALKGFLNEKGNNYFDENFDFENFLNVNKNLKEYFSIEENFNSFTIKWHKLTLFRHLYNKRETNSSEEGIEPNYDFILKKFLINMFKPNLYQSIKTLTGIQDLSQDKILILIIKKHEELFEFLLKNQRYLLLHKRYQEQSINKETSIPKKDSILNGSNQ